MVRRRWVEQEIRVATPRLGRGLDALEAALCGERLPRETVLELRLVAEELITNLAKYGHDDHDEHWVRIRLTIDRDEATLEFRDDGRPFDPLSAKPPDLLAPLGDRSLGGLGIHLALSLVDAATYTRLGSDNVLTLTKRVAGPHMP